MGRPKTVLSPGEKFGRLTVLGEHASIGRDAAYLCQCACGAVKPIKAFGLASGNTQSCGCLRREMVAEQGRRNATHRQTKTPLYRTWMGMRRRCSEAGEKDYHNYGGRGICVCERWRGSFENFAADMGPK